MPQVNPKKMQQNEEIVPPGPKSAPWRVSRVTKVAGSLSLLLALLLAATGDLALERLRAGFRAGALREQSALVATLAGALDARVQGTQAALVTLAGSLTPQLLADPETLGGRLSFAATGLGFPAGLLVLRPDGVVLAGAAGALPARDHAFKDYLMRPLSSGLPFISAPYFPASLPHRPAAVFSVPVRDGSGALRAVLCGAPDLMRDDFLGGLAKLKPGRSGYLTLRDRAGTLLLHPEQSGIPQRRIPLALPAPGLPGSQRSWSAETRDANGGVLLVHSRELASTGWILTSHLPQAEAYRALREGTRFFWLVLVLAFCAALPLAWWLAGRYAAPLIEMLQRSPLDPAGPQAGLVEPGKTQTELGLLRKILDAIPTPIFYKDAAGRYLGANRAFEKYLGCERSQIIGKSVFEISPSEQAEVYFAADRALMDQGGEQRYESRVFYADGVPRDVIFYKAVYGGDDGGDGEVGGIVGTFLDITERKRTEALLEEQKDFSENLVQNLAVPAFVLNARHEVIIWNRACEELSGIPASEVIGTSRQWCGFHLEEHPTQADLVLDGDYREADNRYNTAWQRSALIPGGMQGEGWCRNRQGLDGYLMFSSAPVRNRAGEIIAAMQTVEDITARKRSEDRLRTLSLAVEQSPSIVVITDTAGVIEYVNRKFVEVTGYSSEEAVGANPSLLKSGATPDEVYRELWRTVSAGGEWRGEFQNKKKGGELYAELAIIAPVSDEHGIICHYMALKEDVTERRALATALRHAQKMESLGTLTGGVAHDFNNILTAIIGYGNLIQMKCLPPDPCARFASQVVAAAEKAAVLTRGLLAYSRNQSMDPAHLDLNEVVGRVDRLLSRVLGEGIALSTGLHPEPLRLFADSGQLEQMLMNLAVNARDAMPQGGSLRIRTEAFDMEEDFLKHKGFGTLGRYARLSVSDSGVGLDQATRERIFEPFFTTQGVGGGPGLGLSIVHGIVEQHKGFIEVESEPGQGSVFQVYLPLVLPVQRVPQPAPRQGTGGETVLVVEDNPEVRGIIGEILRGNRYQVLEAADSEEGLRLFAGNAEKVNLLLVDVVMPGKGGLELYREIRALNAGVRVLFMSGYPEEHIRAQGVAGDLAFISKPLAAAELLTRVSGVLDA
jgi:two-component system, cell cycle sensor histidine kinase and response regulator CckA